MQPLSISTSITRKTSLPDQGKTTGSATSRSFTKTPSCSLLMGRTYRSKGRRQPWCGVRHGSRAKGRKKKSWFRERRSRDNHNRDSPLFLLAISFTTHFHFQKNDLIP